MITICGIAGISLNPSDTKLNTATATASLLRGIASRGGDATGAAWYDKESDAVKLTKVAVDVAKFLGARESVLPEHTPAMILHTRFATTGSKANRLNNHPIQYGNIIGVHNGVLWDHEGMFKELGLEPHAEVDSEAIMALLSSTKDPAGHLAEIAGDAALAWIDLYDPEVLHLARVVDRPLIIAQTEEGSLLFASTLPAVREAARAAGVEIEYELDVPEAKYIKVVGGTIAEYLDIPGVTVNRAWSRKYAYTSGTGSAQAGKGMKPAPKGTAAPAKAGAEPLFSDRDRVGGVEETLARMPTAELVTLVQNGSVAALDRLRMRGLTGTGTYSRHIPDAEVKEMAEAGDLWASCQLMTRDPKQSRGGDRPLQQRTISELVTGAAGGSTMSAWELDRRGYDRAGVYRGEMKELDDSTLIDMSTEMKDAGAIAELARRGLDMFGNVIPIGYREKTAVR